MLFVLMFRIRQNLVLHRRSLAIPALPSQLHSCTIALALPLSLAALHGLQFISVLLEW